MLLNSLYSLTTTHSCPRHTPINFNPATLHGAGRTVAVPYVESSPEQARLRDPRIHSTKCPGYARSNQVMWNFLLDSGARAVYVHEFLDPRIRLYAEVEV